METSNILLVLLLAPATVLRFVLSLIHFKLTGVPLV
ncbi:Uncharacterised protein [Hafnia alvei]|nr:Uncharacterised protein [Hafnia alvei]